MRVLPPSTSVTLLLLRFAALLQLLPVPPCSAVLLHLTGGAPQTFPGLDPANYTTLPLDQILRNGLPGLAPGVPIELEIDGPFTFSAAAGWAPFSVPTNETFLIDSSLATGVQSPLLIQASMPVLLRGLAGATINLTGLIVVNTDIGVPLGVNASSAFLRPAFLVMDPGSMLILNQLTFPVSCERLIQYQQFGCSIRDGLGGIEVNPKFVYVDMWTSPGFSASGINVTCAESDADPLPAPACLTSRAHSGEQLLAQLAAAAGTTLGNSSGIPYPVRIYIRGNISVPMGAVPVNFSGTLLVLGQPDLPTELDLNLQPGLVRLMQGSALTITRLSIVNLSPGLESTFPSSMMLGNCYFAAFNRSMPAPGYKLRLVNVSLTVPADLVAYLAHWSLLSQQNDPSADWLDNYPAYASQLGQVAPDNRSLVITQTAYGMALSNVTLRTCTLLQPLLNPSAGLTTLAADPFAPPATLTAVRGGPAGLAAALAAPPTQNLVLMSSVLVLNATLAADGASGWPVRGVTLGRPLSGYTSGPVSLAGFPGSTTVLDFGAGVSSIRLWDSGPGTVLTLRGLVLVNMGLLANTSATSPLGFRPVFLHPKELGNFSSALWSFAFDRRSQNAVELTAGTTIVVPPVEYAALALMLRNQPAALKSASSRILRPALSQALGVVPANSTTSTTVAALTFTAGGQVWANVVVTATLPPDAVSLIGAPVLCCDAPASFSGLTGWQVAVVVVCSVFGAAVLIVAALMWRLLRQRAAQHASSLKVAAERARLDLELAAAAQHAAARSTAALPFNHSHHSASSCNNSWTDVIKHKYNFNEPDSLSGEHAPPSGGRDAPGNDLDAMIKNLQQDVRMHQVVVEDVLGRGGYGIVYKGKWRNLTVAVKTLLFQETADGGKQSAQRSMALSEAAINTTLIHPNIVNTYAYELENLDRLLRTGESDPFMAHRPAEGPARCLTSDWKLYIVQEYCDAGTLADIIDEGKFLKASGDLDLARVLDVAMGIASGMTHIHMNKIIHGDLGPRNVMLQTEAGRKKSPWLAKVGDFGLSRKLAHGQSHFSNARQGTPFYTAPEVQVTGTLAKEADVYAFGMLLHEMVHGTPTWRQSGGSQVCPPQRDAPHFSDTCPADYTALAQKCIDPDPKNRPTFGEIYFFLEEMELHRSGKVSSARGDGSASNTDGASGSGSGSGSHTLPLASGVPLGRRGSMTDALHHVGLTSGTSGNSGGSGVPLVRTATIGERLAAMAAAAAAEDAELAAAEAAAAAAAASPSGVAAAALSRQAVRPSTSSSSGLSPVAESVDAEFDCTLGATSGSAASSGRLLVAMPAVAALLLATGSTSFGGGGGGGGGSSIGGSGSSIAGGVSGGGGSGGGSVGDSQGGRPGSAVGSAQSLSAPDTPARAPARPAQSIPLPSSSTWSSIAALLGPASAASGAPSPSSTPPRETAHSRLAGGAPSTSSRPAAASPLTATAGGLFLQRWRGHHSAPTGETGLPPLPPPPQQLQAAGGSSGSGVGGVAVVAPPSPSMVWSASRSGSTKLEAVLELECLDGAISLE